MLGRIAATVHAITVAGYFSLSAFMDQADAQLITGTRCNIRLSPEQLTDCLHGSIQQPAVSNLITIAARACLKNQGAVTKRCIGLTIQETASQTPIAAPSPAPSIPQRASEAAQAYCQGIKEKNSYATCYYDAMNRLLGGPGPAAAAAVPAQSNNCDPSMWAWRVEATATPGTDPAAKMMAVEQILHLYGCPGSH